MEMEKKNNMKNN